MAEVKATVNANVDCTALVHADLAALMVELVGDLRERCKRLESRELVRNAWGAGLSGLQQQLAQVTAERDEARQKQLEKHVEWASFYNGLQANLNTVKAELGAARKQVAELTKKLRELPPETAPEPYDWQVGDDIECNGVTRRKVIDRREGWVFLEGVTSPLSQPDWERRRWKLYRKAADLPDIQPSTPQQVADFAAVTEPIDDSTGTDGEGQS
jgi:small-conductance mechanosensitive channel